MKSIEVGNLNIENKKEPEKRKQWVVGYFADDGSLLNTNDIEVKWSEHKAGDRNDTVRAQKIGRTLVVLIEGKIKISFPDFDEVHILENRGDYVAFGPKVFHTSEMLEDSLVLTIRWPSTPGDVITK